VRRHLTSLVLVLLLGGPVPGRPGGPITALAQDAPATDTPEPAVQDAPILVQAHQAFVRVQGSTARGSTTWTIAVLDPERAEGLVAPAELEGASARGARIVDGHLDLPDGLSPGTVLSFQADLRQPRTPFAPSGVFRTVPGLPVARAELVVRYSRAPLSVWTDPTAQAEWNPGGRQEARVVWTDIDPDQVAEAIWTASPGWEQASQALERTVEPMLTDKLGRVLGQNLGEISPARAAERVFQEIALVRGPDTGWTGRPARFVIEGGSGTRAERGAVLISVLRAAGYDARPGLYRPSTLEGTVPTSIAATSLLQRPVVAVLRGNRIEWIDPGADHVLPPDLPVELTGAVAWRTGDLPRRLEASGASEGSVPLSGEVRLERDGGESFILNLTATGTAEEWLEERLRGLDDAARADLFRPIVAAGRPETDRLSVGVTGLGDGDQPLRVTVRGHATGRLSQVSRGVVRDRVPSVLAPGLAAWMPPRITVHEEIAITPPPGLRLLTTVDVRPPTHPGAVVSSTLRREADKMVMTTDVERPRRHLPPTDAARAAQTLRQASQSGPELLYVEGPTARTARAAGTANLDAAERTTLQAMLWWRLARYRKARKLLERMMEPVGLAELDAALVRYDAPYELRRTLADLPSSDRDRLASVPILLEQGREADAWARAAQVSTSRQHDLRVQSRLYMLDLQPDARPDPATDPEAAARWREPDELLAEADASGRQLGEGKPDPRVLARKARHAMENDHPEEAVALLQVAVERTDDPTIAVALAAASAAAGAPLDEVHARLQQAVSRAPSSPELLAQVSDAYARAEQPVRALEHALSAARLDQREAAHWDRVVDRALQAGQLTTALYAARRASDLALSDARAASQLTRVATLAGDEEAANLGWSRGGTPLDVSWPPALGDLIGLVEQPHLLALLRHHDAAVIRDAGLLSLRAQLELARGDRDRAVRDGKLLSQRHGIARGEVVAFGAAMGQAWSSRDASTLNNLAGRDPAARSIRLELAALFQGGRTQARILGVDLGAMKDDPRAKLWKQLREDPKAFAARDADWQAGRPPRGGPPIGFVQNELLSGVTGVQAWSDAQARRAVLRHGGTQPLPPPLSVLFTASTPPVASVPGEGRVWRLDDGSFTVYAAARQEGPEWVVGLGTSIEDAARALEQAPPL